MTPSIRSGARCKAVWGLQRTIAIVGLLALGFPPAAFAAGQHSRRGPKAKPGAPNSRVNGYKLDEELTERSTRGRSGEKTRVIVTLVPGASLPHEFKSFSKGRLDILNGHVLELSNGQLKNLAAHPNVFRVHFDRPVKTHNYRTSATVGAATVRQTLGYTGAGIGIAIVDSGIATWHDDLTPAEGSATYPYGQQRVAKFVDFVHGQALPYDDNGHGSHVAGTIAGNGYDSNGQKAGIAPGASLVSLKVLDANGQGNISNLIAALDWVTKNAATYNIRVVNMSVGANIHESYWTDPLTLAAKRVADQGIVIVAAAGNMGKNAAGHAQWGAITAPGNAPWVLTVGASSTMGTLTRTDDTMASYSSRGPTFIDYGAKPDLVAPGTGTVSLAVPGSLFYATKTQYLLPGSRRIGSLPYLSLSGTSMAAPVVSGSVALMLQANPKLTPNLVKAILQYTAQMYPGYKPLEEGAGFLNTLGAVRLARFFKTAQVGDRVPTPKVWSRHIIWGNHMLTGGYITPSGNAWGTNIVWGDATAGAGDNIVWGSIFSDGDNIVWGSMDSSDNIVWGSSFDPNIVWGSSVGANDNIVWGSVSGDDNIVWGSDCGGADCDNIVWGSVSNGDNIVWGSAAPDDNIVWGSAAPDDNIVWGSSLDPNIVWGSSAGEDVTWGSSGDAADAVVFGDEATEPLASVELELGDAVTLPSDPTTSTTTTTAAAGGF